MIFLRMQKILYTQVPQTFLKVSAGTGLAASVQTKQITETQTGRFNLLVPFDAFSQSGKGVRGKKASFL